MVSGIKTKRVMMDNKRRKIDYDGDGKRTRVHVPIIHDGNMYKFNQPLGRWNVASLVYTEGMFLGNEEKEFTRGLDQWNDIVGRITNDFVYILFFF